MDHLTPNVLLKTNVDVFKSIEGWVAVCVAIMYSFSLSMRLRSREKPKHFFLCRYPPPPVKCNLRQNVSTAVLRVPAQLPCMHILLRASVVGVLGL